MIALAKRDAREMMRGGSKVVHHSGTYAGRFELEGMIGTDAAGEPVQYTQTVVRVVTGEPDAAVGDALEVDGTDYVVREVLVDPGLGVVTRLRLAKT